ncbi:MAG TPA: amino acid permease [Gemmatimonadaceae bacterium]|nr:amino acid permease [Gemmatimonadaceae bacterium]
MSTVATEPGSSQSHTEFVRALTLTDATMLVAGIMIGSGIFIVSADMSRLVGSPFWLLLAWVITGIITLLGALSYGELAAMFPRAGGQYVFLREAWGPLMGFLYGWTLFVVIQTGTIAAVAVAFGDFLGVLWPAVGPARYGWFPHFDFTSQGSLIQAGLSPERLVALVSIWVLTWINLRGVRTGKTVQTTLTMIKIAALALLIILGLTIGRNASAILANFHAGNFFAPHVDMTSAFVLAFGAALVGSLFSSDSWNNVTFAAAEVQNPKRNIPLALALGTGMVTLLYVLANVAYLAVLPLHGTSGAASLLGRGIQFATQDRVGTAAAEVILGASGGIIMAILILISTFGCNNGLILSAPRVYWAMARDRLFFKKIGTLNAREVPAVALVVQGVWASVLTLTGTYSQLLDFVIFAGLLFYASTTLGLFILRRKRPDAERPYRAFGYPVVPALYILSAATIAVLLLLSGKTRLQAISGLVLVLIGVPVYYIWQRAGGNPDAASTGAA